MKITLSLPQSLQFLRFFKTDKRSWSKCLCLSRAILHIKIGQKCSTHLFAQQDTKFIKFLLITIHKRAKFGFLLNSLIFWPILAMASYRHVDHNIFSSFLNISKNEGFRTQWKNCKYFSKYCSCSNFFYFWDISNAYCF